MSSSFHSFSLTNDLFVCIFAGYKSAVLGCIYSLLLVTQVRNFREPVANFLGGRILCAEQNNNQKSGRQFDHSQGNENRNQSSQMHFAVL
jgi:hypothetical protein